MIDEKTKLKNELSGLEYRKKEIEERLKHLDENTNKYYGVPVVFFAKSREDAQTMLDSIPAMEGGAWASLQEVGEDIEIPPSSYGEQPNFARAARSIMMRLSAAGPIREWDAYKAMRNNPYFEDFVYVLSHISDGFREVDTGFPDELQELVNEMLIHFSNLFKKSEEVLDAAERDEEVING